MIERFNRTLGEALSKLKEVYNWDKFVKPTLMAYNTSQQNSTKMTPYFLMYERTARLPLEEEVLSRTTLLDRVITMIHKLPIFRESAKVIIKVLYKGTYKVADHMGVRKQPINGDHLKRYHKRTEPRVVISELV